MLNYLRTQSFWALTVNLKSLRPYIYILLSIFTIFFLLVFNVEPQKVGDGHEYYAFFLAWKETLRPWVNDTALAAYSNFIENIKMPGRVPADFLQTVFPALHVHHTLDFNHFWFYSLLALITFKFAKLFGLSLSVHLSFVALHFILLLVTTFIAYRFYKWKGVVVSVLMIFLSPMLWYVDKVHTEFFTICLVLSSVILVLNARYIFAALFLAAASTQNPSFALIAGYLAVVQLILQRGRTYNVFEVTVIVLTVLLVVIHPAYYFTRYGVATPQLLAGGADLGTNLSKFYVWLIDPDLGLLPNWPIGSIAIGVGIFLWITKKVKRKIVHNELIWWGFLFFYLIVNLYANSSTTNLNSGATPGISRYALWYLPLAFPFFLHCITWLYENNYYIKTVTIILGIYFIYNFILYRPSNPDSFTTPSNLSMFIQTYLPSFYNPPEDVFIYRYSGWGDDYVTYNYTKAIVGQDCKKLLLLKGSDRKHVLFPKQCFFELGKLTEIVDLHRQQITKNTYSTLSADDISKSRLLIKRDQTYVVGTQEFGNFILGDGWSIAEPWGIWSEKGNVILHIPCYGEMLSANYITLLLNLHSFTDQKLQIKSGEKVLWSGKLVNFTPTDIKIAYPSKSCHNDQIILTLEISHPVSPAELGMSDDIRKLGVGLRHFSMHW